MPKVSVIIPVYGVEKYIERCARSLFEQTLDDIEFIFVNDCTLDNSINVLETTLEEYPKRKSQVQIINFEQNQGAAKAREIGMKTANGEYIIHCDSDDWVVKEAYETLYNIAKASESDMVICDWFETDGIQHKHITQTIPSLQKDILQGLVKRGISASLWNRLVSRNVIQSNNIIYPTAHMMEDVALSIQLTYFCKKITYVSTPLYFYFSNDNSICKKIGTDTSLIRYNQACSNVNIVIDFLKHQSVLKDFSKEVIILKNYPRTFIWKLLLENPTKYYKLWINTYPEINCQYIHTKGVPFSLKLIFLLTLLRIYPYIHKIIKALK